jgi:hypothetical protein
MILPRSIASSSLLVISNTKIKKFNEHRVSKFNTKKLQNVGVVHKFPFIR